MRILILLLVSGCLFSGCAKMKSWLPSRPKKNASVSATPTVPANSPTALDSGMVAMVNRSARFVVITFPIGGVPAINRKLNVYRNSLKVGEVKVTGPQRDSNTVADILSGEIQLNDEVRAD